MREEQSISFLAGLGLGDPEAKVGLGDPEAKEARVVDLRALEALGDLEAQEAHRAREGPVEALGAEVQEAMVALEVGSDWEVLGATVGREGSG